MALSTFPLLSSRPHRLSPEPLIFPGESPIPMKESPQSGLLRARSKLCAAPAIWLPHVPHRRAVTCWVSILLGPPYFASPKGLKVHPRHGTRPNFLWKKGSCPVSGRTTLRSAARPSADIPMLLYVTLQTRRPHTSETWSKSVLGRSSETELLGHTNSRFPFLSPSTRSHAAPDSARGFQPLHVLAVGLLLCLVLSRNVVWFGFGFLRLHFFLFYLFI